MAAMLVGWALSLFACETPEEDPTVNQKPSRILIENFESNTHRQWSIEGNAFGWTLATTEQLKEWGNYGYEGGHILTGWLYGDAGIGTMTSQSFTIERDYINFLVSGGGHEDNLYAALVVDGVEVLKAMGDGSRKMQQVVWDVKEWVGKQACIRLVDRVTRPWGFIEVDYFYQSPDPATANKTRTIAIEKDYLNFPIDPDSPLGEMRILVDGKVELCADLRLTDGVPDHWVHMNCSQWKGKSVEILIPFNQFIHSESPIACGNALESIYQSDEPGESATFYGESLRPVAHFTSIRGWLNDPCGLVYMDGVWHLSYQHNRFGRDWGNISWGHVVSRDLAHWEELDDVLLPDDMGAMFSGYSIVDKNNTLGVTRGSHDTIVAYYTAAGLYNYASSGEPFTTCLAYSTDGGFTYQKWENNPVIGELAVENRDPHVVWSPEDNCWVMVLFYAGNTFGLLTSTDLVNWQERSRIDIPNSWECPDLMRMQVKETGEWLWVLMGVHNTYYVGRLSGGVFTPITELQKQDYGELLYASHTFANAPGGRFVQIGCQGGSVFPMLAFDQMMAFPKELSLHTSAKGFSLHAEPVEEIVNLYGSNVQTFTDKQISAEEKVTSSGVAFHVKASINLAETTASKFGFVIDGVNITYMPANGYIGVTGSNMRHAVNANNIVPKDGILDLEIILDTGMVEVFANDGEFSSTVFCLSPNRDKSLTTTADGGVVKYESLTVAELTPYWN